MRFITMGYLEQKVVNLAYIKHKMISKLNIFKKIDYENFKLNFKTI